MFISLPIFNERSLEREDEYDVELTQPTIKSESEATNMAEQPRDFAQFNGHQELSLASSKVNDILSDIKLRKPKQQTLICNIFLLGQIGLKDKTQKIRSKSFSSDRL